MTDEKPYTNEDHTYHEGYSAHNLIDEPKEKKRKAIQMAYKIPKPRRGIVPIRFSLIDNIYMFKDHNGKIAVGYNVLEKVDEGFRNLEKEQFRIHISPEGLGEMTFSILFFQTGFGK